MKIYFIIILIVVGCKNSTQNHNYLDEKINKESSASNNNPNKNTSDTTGFLKNCKEWTSGISIGFLQGVKSTMDSLGAFCFYECYDCQKTYNIIFIHKTKRGKDLDGSLSKEFSVGCNNNYVNFNCFAFIYPMRNPDKQKNVHALNFDLPLTIKAYKRISDDNWEFVRSETVKTFTEFSTFQYKIIYNLK